MAEYGRKAPGPDVVAHKIVSIANTARPWLHNLVTKEAQQCTMLKRALPSGAFEAGVRRGFKLQTRDDHVQQPASR